MRVIVIFFSLLIATSLVNAGVREEVSSPVSVITKESLENLPASRNIGDILNPLLSGVEQRLVQEDAAQAQVNFQNNLILVNGRRVSKQQEIELGNFLSQDTSAIPRAMIDRIEVIKGGDASSIYGSDAVRGVVNFITRSDLFA